DFGMVIIRCVVQLELIGAVRSILFGTEAASPADAASPGEARSGAAGFTASRAAGPAELFAPREGLYPRIATAHVLRCARAHIVRPPAAADRSEGDDGRLLDCLGRSHDFAASFNADT